jgi:hypothetical protein
MEDFESRISQHPCCAIYGQNDQCFLKPLAKLDLFRAFGGPRLHQLKAVAGVRQSGSIAPLPRPSEISAVHNCATARDDHWPPSANGETSTRSRPPCRTSARFRTFRVLKHAQTWVRQMASALTGSNSWPPYIAMGASNLGPASRAMRSSYTVRSLARSDQSQSVLRLNLGALLS